MNKRKEEQFKRWIKLDKKRIPPKFWIRHEFVKWISRQPDEVRFGFFFRLECQNIFKHHLKEMTKQLYGAQ